MSAFAWVTPRRKRRITSAFLTTLTYLILLIMIAPIFWLIVGATQTSTDISNGTYDVLHPTLHAFSAMWKSIDFGHYLANSLIICSVSALLATALASGAGYAGGAGRDVPAPGLPRVRVAQEAHADPAVRHAYRDDPRVHGVLHAGVD